MILEFHDRIQQVENIRRSTKQFISSGKSVVLLSSLFLDTDLLSEVCLLIVAPFQCCHHHQIQFFIIQEIFARY